MNRKEMRDRVLQGLNDSTSSPVFFSLSQVNRFIDEALETLSEEVLDVRRTAYVPRREGSIYYTIRSIAPDIMSPYRVTLHEENSRLDYTLIDDLDLYRERWMEVVGDRPHWWFPVSWDMFGVWPGSAASDGFLRVDYIAWPESLRDDFDEPEFSLSNHDACVLYGIAEGLLHQWDTVRALDYWTQFAALWRDRAGRAEARKLQNSFLYRMQLDGPSSNDLSREM